MGFDRSIFGCGTVTSSQAFPGVGLFIPLHVFARCFSSLPSFLAQLSGDKESSRRFPGAQPTTNYEYQYHLKDHLGNVRLTFTASPEIETDEATIEPENAEKENAAFINYDKVTRINSTLFDKTGETDSRYSIRLSGAEGEKIGLARSMAVMTGDTIRAKVYGKYLDPEQPNYNQLVQGIVATVASTAMAPGAGVEGSLASEGSNFPFDGLLSKTAVDDGQPQAYLNYLVFDKNMVLIEKKSGYEALTTAAREDGTNRPHEELSTEIIVTEPGYVYIYLSNDSPMPKDVYFDQFNVEHAHSAIVQSDDYYPGGLTFNSYTSGTENLYKFNGKEEQKELGLYDYGARFYDPAINRWHAIDPHADRYWDHSPYNYVYNNFPNAVDRDGRDGIVIVFPDYNVDTEPFAGKQPLGHAGVLLIDNKTGYTRYYEYGRYKTEDGTKGRVRNISVSNVKIGPDGKPTSKSLNKVLGQISKQSGQGGRIEGAYIESDEFDAMNDYAQGMLNQSTFGNADYDADRDPYSVTGNNCGTFACDVVNQDEKVKDKSPWILIPTPDNIAEEYQGVFDAVSYDPETGATKYTVNKAYWQQILDMFKKEEDNEEGN